MHLKGGEVGEVKVAYGYSVPEAQIKALQSISPDVRLVSLIDLMKEERRKVKEHGVDSAEAQKARQELDIVLGHQHELDERDQTGTASGEQVR